MCSENATGLFEIHIAGPQTELSVARRVFDGLREVGLMKNKFFLGMYNVPAGRAHRQVACTPPTGHDLPNPGWMTTAKTRDFDQAKHYVLAGMDVLARHDLEGNFEIEQVIEGNTPDYHVNLERDFPSYQRVADSPTYENHIIWKAGLADLPSNDQICRSIEDRFGIRPHQIVDFSKDHSGNSLVSRVATIYQPDRDEALRFGLALPPDEHVIGHKYLVTEQVCLVGERKT